MKRRIILAALIGVFAFCNANRAFGQSDEELAEAKRLNDKCLESLKTGRYDEGIEPCQRILATAEKFLGGEDAAVATLVNNLAALYYQKGDYMKAEPLFQRALAIYEKTLGSDHPNVAASLNNLAELYEAKGDYAKAEPLLQRALAIDEKALGGDHPGVAADLGNLGKLYYQKGDYAKAKLLYQRALAIYEKASGGAHPDSAALLNNLAELYRAEGDYAKAELMFQRAQAMYEKVLGGDHPDLATSLYNLANLYNQKGDYAKAEPLYRRALAIYEKALGSEHPNVALLLNSLAVMYEAKGDYAKAEPLLQRALAIDEKALGGDHPSVAIILTSLATVYRANGDYAKVEPLLQRILAIDEKALGSEHPYVATALGNLAVWHFRRGDYARAEPLLQRALMIQEKALGDEHPDVAKSFSNLAGLYEAKGDIIRALDYLRRGLEIEERNISAILATGSEAQKQLYLDTLSARTDGIISSHVHTAAGNPQAAQLALTTILRRKGRALDATAEQIAALRRRAAPEDAKLLDRLAAAQSELATLQLSNDTKIAADLRRARVKQLRDEIERLQNEISRRSSEFRAQVQPITLNAVRDAIPSDAALVEFFAYQPLNIKAKIYEKNYGAPRYVVYVLKPKDDAPQFVELGEASAIDADVAKWREALLDPDRKDVKELARMVDERVMRPVRKLLGDKQRIFISPDGALNLIPFAALVDENGKYLVENYSLNYLTSGRDLLRLQIKSESKQGAMIFANPTYDMTGATLAACEKRKKSNRRGIGLEPVSDKDNGKNAGNNQTVSDVSARSIDFTKLCYDPLKGTAEEAKQIGGALTDAKMLTEKAATEAALKEVNAPRILHIATHGFFLPDQPQQPNTNGARGFGLSDAPAPSARRVENPLLRSGIIMAGVNQGQSGTGEDGVLTALEAAGLNLWGTKLVVLSACETGLGDVRNGVGVYGLRRALVLAGSETQLMSLWKVSDSATRDLMIDYYTRLQRGEGRTEAMRQAQLSMLRGETQSHTKETRGLVQETSGNDRRAHPYYWAAFIESGDWRNLDDK